MKLFKSFVNDRQMEMLRSDATIPSLNRNQVEDLEKFEAHEKLLALGFVELRECGTTKNSNGEVRPLKMACRTEAGMDYILLGDCLYKLHRFSKLLSLPLAIIALVISVIALVL